MYHLVLLAKNEQGYRNLLALNYQAYRSGFYYKPRIDWELLEQYGNNLICMTACLAGYQQQKLLDGDMSGAIEITKKYQEIFKDDLYLEVHNHNLKDELKVLPQIKKISQELSIPMVAANDAHYLDKKDAELHRIILAIQTGKTLEEFMNSDFEGFVSSDEFYFKSEQEILEAFGEEWKDAINNTVEIAKKIDIKIPELEEFTYKFPVFDISSDRTPDEELRELTYRGFAERVKEKKLIDNEAYRNRLKEELDTIIEMGFSNYFLILEDLLRWCRKKSIRYGLGRGSALGSLVVYCLGITKVDPLKYNLLFSRFLNKNRVSLPDYYIVVYNGNIIDYELVNAIA